MAAGMEMMLKSLGLDPKVIMAKVGEFQDGIKTVLTNISLRLDAIEKTQGEIREAQKVNYNLLTELTAWKRIQQSAQPPLRSVQPPPNPPQDQPMNPPPA